MEHEEKAAQILTRDRGSFEPDDRLGRDRRYLRFTGRTSESHSELRGGLSIAGDLNNGNADAGRHARNLSLAYIQMRQWDVAAVWNQRALNLPLAAVPKATFPTCCETRHESRSAAVIPTKHRHLRGSASLERGPAQRPMGDVCTDGRDRLETKRFPKALREFESARKIIDGTRSELLSPHYRITLLSRLIAFYRGYVGALVDQNNDAEALRVVESSRAPCSGRAPQEGSAAGVVSRPPQDPATVRALTHSSFLSFWLARRVLSPG